MSYKVKFTPQAEIDIGEAADYIAENFGGSTVLRFPGSIVFTGLHQKRNPETVHQRNT